MTFPLFIPLRPWAIHPHRFFYALAGSPLGAVVLDWFLDPAAWLRNASFSSILLQGKTVVGGLLEGLMGLEISKKHGLLFLFLRSRNPRENGDLFKIFIAGYLLFRFLIDFLKPYPRVFAGLNIIQLACVGGIFYYRHDFKRLFLPPTNTAGGLPRGSDVGDRP